MPGEQHPGEQPQGDGASTGRLPAVWRRLAPLGYASGLVSFASVAAPLLTGFSLTAVVELVGRDARGTRGDVAIAAFSVAAGLLIYAIQAGLAAGQLAVPPDQRAAQVPEARGYHGWMEQLRSQQWRDTNLAERLFFRTRLAYNFGILAFLAGLFAVLLPGPGDWNLARIAALTAAGGAGVVELIVVSEWPRPASRWLLPTLQKRREPRLEGAATVVEPDKIDTAAAQWLVYGQGRDYERSCHDNEPEQPGAGPGHEDVATALIAMTAQLASLTAQLAQLEAAVGDATAALTERDRPSPG
jgi:hypothetical protein